MLALLSLKTRARRNFFICQTCKIVHFLNLLVQNTEENFAQIHLPDW